MSRTGLGFREYAALAILLAAAATTFVFFRNGDAARQDSAKRLIDGPPFDSPHVPIQGEGPWQVTWLVVTPGGGDIVAGDSSLDRLEVDDAGPAEAARQGNAAKLRAVMRFDGPAGTYHVRLRFRGLGSIAQDGAQLVQTGGQGTPGEFTIFVHVAAAPATFVVETTSEATGPLSAHWSMVRVRP